MRAWGRVVAAASVGAAAAVTLSGCFAGPMLGGQADGRQQDAKYRAPLSTAYAQLNLDGHRLLMRTQIVAPVTGVAGGYCNHLSVEVARDEMTAGEQAEVLDWLLQVAWATDTHVDGTKPSCVSVSAYGAGVDLGRAAEELGDAGDVFVSPGVSAEWDRVTVRDPVARYGAWPGRDRDPLRTGVPDVLQGSELRDDSGSPSPRPTATSGATGAAEGS